MAPEQDAQLRERFAKARILLRTAAVTGTNGKTTTTSMIASMIRAAGVLDARVTTLGAWVGDEPIHTPQRQLELLATVERTLQRGGRLLALETTSLALANGFAQRWPADVAVLTNLTHDHLDVHGSPEAYLAAKAQLFVHLREGGSAVFNADDPSSALVAEVTRAGTSHLHFAVDAAHADLRALTIEVSAEGTRVTLAPSPLAAALGHTLTTRAIGRVHAQNVMAAALAAHALGLDADAIQAGARRFVGVPGRFELVGTAPLVVVDYAHTPDALRQTLETARAIAPRGELILVFGCGGERDLDKRPMMGAIADAHADRVLLTSDNPRGEDPEAIADAIVSGSRASALWSRQLDRRAAIAAAIQAARPEDIVVIAGRGHEAHQVIAGRQVALLDAECARDALALRDG